MAGSGRKVWAADEVLAAADLQDYIQDQVVFVYNDSSARASGILSPTEGMVSYLKDTNLLYAFDGSNWIEIAPNVGTPGTYTKVTTDSKGRVSSGTTLSASDIPDLDTAKLTSGILSDDRVPNVGTAGTYTKVTTDGKGRVSSGTTLSASDIPSLDASKTTSGSFSADRIPSLDASKITTGTLSRPVSTSGAGAFNSIAVNGANAAIASDGSGYFNAGLTNPYANSHPVSGQAIYMSSVGTFGVGASTMRVKKNIVDAQIDVDAVLGLRVRNFVYDADLVESDGSVQIGVIAEELEALGLTEFVIYDAAGVVSGVHYDRLALALIPVLQVQQSRLDLLADRVSKLECR